MVLKSLIVATLIAAASITTSFASTDSSEPTVTNSTKPTETQVAVTCQVVGNFIYCN